MNMRTAGCVLSAVLVCSGVAACSKGAREEPRDSSLAGRAGSGASGGEPRAGAGGALATGSVAGAAGAPGGTAGGMSGGASSTDGRGAAGIGGDATGVLALPARSFLDSIGVCTHIGQGIDAPTESADAMVYAGIRNLRDDGRPEHVDDWITVFELSGVRTAILTNHDVASTIDMALALNAAGALLAVEGPNEPNNFPVTYEGQTSDYETSFLPVAHLQRDLYAAVTAEPSLAGVPVFHSSEAGGAEPDNVGLQFLTIPAEAGTLVRRSDGGQVHAGHGGNELDAVAAAIAGHVAHHDADPHAVIERAARGRRMCSTRRIGGEKNEA